MSRMTLQQAARCFVAICVKPGWCTTEVSAKYIAVQKIFTTICDDDDNNGMKNQNA